ncbi:MAG: hypothetical protein KZQ99_18640 [Candidatus Thiodiazotropha sp. (ex Dulcina madagascariensis)]|nr:hypothetical protein [Candidatus Thiodiazotropha sp. (ex Dulcina madagascariensis)]
MVQRLLKIARQHGAETVFPEVRIGNRAALRRYEKLCFVQTGRRRNYYPAADEQREDALVMSLEL